MLEERLNYLSLQKITLHYYFHKKIISQYLQLEIYVYIYEIYV
jgi:hypothetical protein